MLRALLALLLLALPAALRAEEPAPAPAPVIITGVLLEHDTGYPPGVLSEDWHRSFTLVAWRKGDGPVQTTQMWVTFTAPTEDKVKAVLARLPERQVVRFTLAGDVTFDKNRPEAMMHEPLPPAPDAELLAAAKVVLNPPPLADPRFGTFEPIGGKHFLFGQQSEWLGETVSVLLELDLRLADTQARTLATLHKAWDQRKRRDREARVNLSQFHEIWRAEFQRPGTAALSRADFAKRLRLARVEAFDNGAFSFYYALDGVDDFPVMRFGVWIDGTLEWSVD